MTWRGTAVACLAAILAVPCASLAEEHAPVASVREHDRLAQQHFEAGDYQDALDELSAAQEILPSPERLFSMAACQQRLERPREAILLYQSYIDHPDSNEDHRDIARRRLASIHAELDETAEETEVEEEEDDEEEEEDEPAVFRRDGVDEQDAVEPVRGRRRLSRTPFYAMLGVTGAAALGVAVLGGITLDMLDQYEAGSRLDVQLRDDGRLWADVTDAILGVACASALVAVVLAIFTDWARRPGATSDARRRLGLGPGGPAR